MRINYRTTEKIRDWAAAVLRGVPIDDLDGGTDTLKGYRSLRAGLAPEVRHFESLDDEKAFVVEQVERWLTEAPAEEICVCGRTNHIVDGYRQALDEAGLHTVVIDPKNEKEGYGVRLATMHRVKGLEFPRMLIAGASDGWIPYTSSRMDLDSAASEEDHLTRERCLLYVAATRARDLLVGAGAGKMSPFLAEA